MGQDNNIDSTRVEVDEAKIRRQAVLSGAWAGIKKGLFWGSIATGALAAGSIAFGLPAAKSAVTGAAGFVGNIPYIGKPLVGLGALILGGGVIEAMSGGPADVALKILTAGLNVFASVGIPIILAGAVIGGVMGAVKGYEQADEKVEAAIRKARREKRELALEQRQTLSAQQQLAATEGQLASQTEELQGSGYGQVGSFSPGFTPEGNNSNGLGGKDGPQYS